MKLAPKVHLVMLSLVGLLGCGGAGEGPGEGQPPEQALAEDACGIDARADLALIRSLSFVRREDGVTRGMDIDGRTSGPDDAEGCFHRDLVDPSGNEGIDNQLSALIPAIEAVGGEAVDSVVERAINGGSVLLLVETRQVDDPLDDSCVEVNLYRAEGTPTIGNKGLIEPGQTFGLLQETPVGAIEEASLSDGQFTAGPFDLTIPATIATFDLELSVRDAVLEFEVQEDGSMTGLISGALVVEELFEILETIEDGTDLLKLIRTVVLDNADLEPDASGVCQRLSMALEFEATPAFIFADEDPELAEDEP